jgi:hypothetical protein
MRRVARRDANERRVIDALRACGAYVKQINDEGAFDLLVFYRGPTREHTLLLEVKDGDKPPSARALTPAESKFHAEWPGKNLHIVNSEHEALDILKRCV